MIKVNAELYIEDFAHSKEIENLDAIMTASPPFFVCCRSWQTTNIKLWEISSNLERGCKCLPTDAQKLLHPASVRWQGKESRQVTRNHAVVWVSVAAVIRRVKYGNEVLLEKVDCCIWEGSDEGPPGNVPSPRFPDNLIGNTRERMLLRKMNAWLSFNRSIGERECLRAEGFLLSQATSRANEGP